MVNKDASERYEMSFGEMSMKHEKLSRDELIDLVRKIIDCDGCEEEIDEMIFLLEENVVDPEIINFIYYDDKNTRGNSRISIGLQTYSVIEKN